MKKIINQPQKVNNFLLIILTYILGARKNRLNEIQQGMRCLHTQRMYVVEHSDQWIIWTPGYNKPYTTPYRRQSKTLLTIDERGSKIARYSFFIAICRPTGDEWHSKTLFLTIFDQRSSIVLTFYIAPYRVLTPRLSDYDQ